jgi:hypothetical protein
MGKFKIAPGQLARLVGCAKMAVADWLYKAEREIADEVARRLDRTYRDAVLGRLGISLEDWRYARFAPGSEADKRMRAIVDRHTESMIAELGKIEVLVTERQLDSIRKTFQKAAFDRLQTRARVLADKRIEEMTDTEIGKLVDSEVGDSATLAPDGTVEVTHDSAH